MPNDEALWESDPNLDDNQEGPSEEDMQWYLEQTYVDPAERDW